MQRLCLSFMFLVLPLERAYSAQVLAELPAVQQEIVERICLPLQYEQGSEAYRECLGAELAARRSAAPRLISTLQVDEQYSVQRACRRAGDITSPAHRICMEMQIELLRTEPEPQYAEISEDERHVIQQACFDVQSSQAAQTYRRCVNEALSTVNELPQSDLSKLPVAERISLLQTCAGRTNDPRDYRQCLLAAADRKFNGSVSAQNQAEIATVAISMDSALPETATAISESAASSSNGDSSAAPATGNLGFVDRDTITPVPDKPGMVIRQSDRPTTNEALASASETAPSQTTEPTVRAQANGTLRSSGEGPEDNFQFADVLKNLQATLNGLSGVNRILTVAALALLLVLIMWWLMFRKRETRHGSQGPSSSDRRYHDVLDKTAFDDNIEDLDTTQKLREQASNLFDDLTPVVPSKSVPQTDPFAEKQRSTAEKNEVSNGNTDIHQGADELLDEQLTEKMDFSSDQAFASQTVEEQRTEKIDFSIVSDAPDQNVQEQPTEKMDFSIASETTEPDSEQPFDELFDKEIDDTINDDLASITGGGGSGEFGVWIEQQSDARQLSFAIEFLIYWLAYADERYEPSLKAMVFKMKDPDEQTKIKRWVLQNDIYSFADAVRWLQSHATLQQRTQIIDLLIALLVSENALTPIQNTLFRFLGDAFGLGQVQLNSHFRLAFNQPLAQLPRVDKPNWWNTYSEEQRIRWNARIVAKQSPDIQHRVKLGLPLKGDLQSAQILACYKRAEARCHPQQFQELGERELHMIERQLVKFKTARDALLESVV